MNSCICPPECTGPPNCIFMWPKNRPRNPPCGDCTEPEGVYQVFINQIARWLCTGCYQKWFYDNLQREELL